MKRGQFILRTHIYSPEHLARTGKVEAGLKKDLMDWERYQGRLWESVHRHAVMVMLAYSFLVWLEWRERPYTRRPGPPRGVFPPRPDRRRCSLAALQRSIADWLRAAAIVELFVTGRITHFRPLQI
jgi:hypothetical protein